MERRAVFASEFFMPGGAALNFNVSLYAFVFKPYILIGRDGKHKKI